jgi:threonine/homoserine/homoserine lactone efflux protein
VIKLAGAVYLVYLGVRLLLAKGHDVAAEIETTSGGEAWTAFRQGVLTNVLNPKVALFFLAFLPQFIRPDSQAKTLAFLALGATFITTGTWWCLVLATCAARLRDFFVRKPRMRTLIDRATGGLFIGLAVRLAASR